MGAACCKDDQLQPASGTVGPSENCVAQQPTLTKCCLPSEASDQNSIAHAEEVVPRQPSLVCAMKGGNMTSNVELESSVEGTILHERSSIGEDFQEYVASRKIECVANKKVDATTTADAYLPATALASCVSAELQASDEEIDMTQRNTQLESLDSAPSMYVSKTFSKRTSHRIIEAHSYKSFHRYGKNLWLAVVSSPVIVVCLVWGLLSDHGCKDGKRNLKWYQWFYDMIYSFFSICVGVSTCDVAFLGISCSNWGNEFRPTFWLICVGSGVATCILVNIIAGIIRWRYDLPVVWAMMLDRSMVVVSSTFAVISVLCFAIYHTSGWKQKKFAIRNWCIIFCHGLWVFALFLSTQAFVAAYLHFQKQVGTEEDKFWSWSSLYDYCMACLFVGFYIKLWAQVGHKIMTMPRETAPPLLKDRLHFDVVLWTELFSTVFGRIIFKEVQQILVLVILMVKDSLARVMDLTLRYNPTRMVRMAIRRESQDKSRCILFWENLLALLLDIDLRLTLEFIFRCRSHSHHAHHLPDETYMTRQVKEVIETHRNHVSRTSWRIAHVEATPTAADSDDDLDGVSPPGTLDWSGAMRRRDEHKKLLNKYPFQSYTTLDPGLRAIQWCERDAEAADVHHLHTTYWWHEYLCKPGLTRAGIKSYLAWVWHCEWSADREYEAEALCDRMCFVQRNIRLQFVAVYLPKIASSVFSIIFLLARAKFPCTLAAYGYKVDPEPREKFIWTYLCIADVLEMLIIATYHWSHKLNQDGDVGWVFVSHVLWDPAFMAMVIFVSIHVVQDAMVAMYDLDF